MQLKSAFVFLAAALVPTAYSAAIGSVNTVVCSSLCYARSFTDTLLTIQTDAAVELAPRDVGNVYVCTDANWEGDCTNLSFASGYCENLAPEFEYDITSIGPDPEWACWFYAYVSSRHESRLCLARFDRGVVFIMIRH